MPTRLTHDKADPAAYDAQRSGHFEDHRVNLVSATIVAEQATDVLEVGAGSGRISWRLATRHPGVRFIAVEPFRPLAEHGSAQYRAANLTRLGAIPPGAPSRVVFSIDVIHHLADRVSVFAEVRRAVSDKGVWVAVEPNIWHPAIWLAQERMRRSGLGEDHFRPWVSEPEFRQAGFAIESRTYQHLWPAAMKRPPPVASAVERRCQGLRLLGGSVVYRLRARL